MWDTYIYDKETNVIFSGGSIIRIKLVANRNQKKNITQQVLAPPTKKRKSIKGKTQSELKNPDLIKLPSFFPYFVKTGTDTRNEKKRKGPFRVWIVVFV